MTDPPLASVVIPTYNSALLLPRTLRSVLSQDYPNIEVVLVDDGSTDETSRVVSSFQDERVRYLHQSNSGGPSKPRNVGVRNARGAYIFLFDSDDEMLPGKIRRSLAALEKATHAGLLFTNFRAMGDDGKPLSEGTFLDTYEALQAVRKTPVGDGAFIIGQEDAFETLVYENFIGTSSVVIPRPVLDDVGPFDESLKNGDDGDMWFRIARHYDLLYLDCVGHLYHRRPGTVQGRSDSLKGPNRVKVLKKQVDLGMPEHLLRPMRRRLARNYFDIGYAYQDENKTRLARASYLLGLREAVTWPLFKGVLVTLLGPRPVVEGRRIRKWLKRRQLKDGDRKQLKKNES